MHRRAFTHFDLLVTIFVVVIACFWLVPVLWSLRGYKGQRTYVRGIHSGMVLFSQGNNGHYPGITSNGQSIDMAIGFTAQGRMQKLIDDKYFTQEYARSPSEVQTGTTSYAMLKIDVNPVLFNPLSQRIVTKSIRNTEWADTTNTEAVVVSDRAVDNAGDNDNTYTHIKSIHTNPSPGTTDWRGSVGWNDNHVTFESTNIKPTKYDTTTHDSDNLFATSQDPDDPNNGNDAFMVFHGTDGL